MTKIFLKFKMFIRLFRTVKDLKLSQIYYQIRSKSYRPKGKEYTHSEPKNFRKINDWLTPTKKIYNFYNIYKKETDDGVNFKFLNEVGSVKLGWDHRDKSTLWNYNLNYQNYLKDEDLDISLRIDLVKLWINDNNDLNSIGWQPYPCSIRIVNWVKLFLQIDSDKLNPIFLSSLLKQTYFLSDNIEFHIQGNHLIANAKALIFSGYYFNDNSILNKGLDLLKDEIDIQFLADGGHFERSPMYHSIMINDMIEIIELYNINSSKFDEKYKNLKNELKKIVKKGIEWLEIMTHGDKKPSFFGDSCENTSIPVSDLINYANYMNIEIDCLSDLYNFPKMYNLKNTNYSIINNPDNYKIILNSGSPGPLFQPGHSHADSLSCEISIYNKRFLVNSGTSTYNNSTQRLFQRSTKAHNTLIYKNKNSSDVWDSFRIGKKAKVFNRKFICDGSELKISATHNGYSNFLNKINHSREIVTFENTITITDRIKVINKIFVFWYFHPNVKLIKTNRNAILCNHYDNLINIEFSNANFSVIESLWFRSHGEEIKSSALVLEKIDKGDILTKIKF